MSIHLLKLMLTVDAVNTIPDVVDAADNDGRLGRLVLELATAGLAGDLQTDGPFTIFAPNDDAQEWGTSMGIANITQILLDHVIAGNFRSEDLVHSSRRRDRNQNSRS